MFCLWFGIKARSDLARVSGLGFLAQDSLLLEPF